MFLGNKSNDSDSSAFGANISIAKGKGALATGPTGSVSYTHLRAHETVLDLVCRLLLEKKKKQKQHNTTHKQISKIHVTYTIGSI